MTLPETNQWVSEEVQNGLSGLEVARKIAAGQINTVQEAGRKTVWQIIASNVFTLFNLVNVLIFVLILSTGQYLNGLFMGVVLSNTLIGIIEEIRARRIISGLRIITAAIATVRRDGAEKQILPEEIVQDDIFVLRPGNQVCADGLVLEADGLEADESLLTGESEPVRKKAGDQVLSGSFIVAGRAAGRVTHVGQSNYAQSMTLEAHRYKRAKSEILTNLNRIIRFISIVLVPLGLLLFASQYFRSVVTWQDAVISSAAGIIGMIPEGLILLTSITMTVGIIKLARRRAIVQELAGLEVLARVEVLCLDKTGTLTRGMLQVTEMLPLGRDEAEKLAQAAAALINAFLERNSTSLALAAYFKEAPDWTAEHKVPFASSRMWSGASFAGHGTWLIGSPEIILSQLSQLAEPAETDQPAETAQPTPPDQVQVQARPTAGQILEQAADYARTGHRVILLASSEAVLSDDGLPDSITPQALILLADVIRPEAKTALDFFASNDVKVKIITGDSPLTASFIAGQLAVAGAGQWVDASQIADDPAEISRAAQAYTVFGRVSPWRKKQLVYALQQQGKVVAMVGDGTNDVLAMHQADCSIVMASGSDAAKAMAHIALLDSDFLVLPGVVSEGRQVINNVERVASLYLVKTTYSMILTVFFILIGASYFFFPIHQTLLGMVGIGIPSFFLALEPNHRRVLPGFLNKIFRTAIPGGIAIALELVMLKLTQPLLGVEMDQARLIAVIITGITSLLVLLRVSWPLNIMRSVLVSAMTLLFFLALIIFRATLNLPAMQPESWLVTLGFAAASYPLLWVLSWLTTRFSYAQARKVQ